MVCIRERQCPSDLQICGSASLVLLAEFFRRLAKQIVKGAGFPVVSAVVVFLLIVEIFTLEASFDRSRICCIEGRSNTKCEERRVQNLSCTQSKPGGSGRHGAEFNASDSTAGLILQCSQLQ